MKKQSFQTILYSALGVAAMAGILVAINVIAGVLKTRIDLTQEKSFSLSKGTKAILSKLDTPVKVRLYFTPGESTADTMQIRNYAKDVEALLDEYRQAAHGKIVIEKLDPQPDSDAEDSARLDGVEPRMLRNGDQVYMGISVSLLDQKEAVPFLEPTREKLLEYDITRAISRVVNPEKAVVGVMSPLPVSGMPANPMMMRMGQQTPRAWTVINELKNDFTVRSVPMDTDKIDDEIKVLMVIHPRDISDKAQFAIDQFVLRGGKLIAFLDPVPAVIDTREQNQMLGAMPNTGSSLDKLLKAWGLSFDTSKVVADLNFKMEIGEQRQDAPAALRVTAEGIDKDDIVTSDTDDIWLPFAGAFTGTPADGLKETVLLKSTKQSELTEGFMARLSGESIMKDFKPSGTEYALAVKLTGKFKTAFPKGKPEEKPDEGASSDQKPASTNAVDSLKESKQETTVVLVGDADMLSDAVAFQQVPTLFGMALQPANGNLTLAQNAVEQLAGDNNLISVRSRATLNRPFTKIKAMEAAANQKFQEDIRKLEEKAQAAQQRLSELQSQRKDRDQRFVLSPEQAAEIRKFREEEAETNKKLKELKKKFRQEIVSLQTTIKWVNILVVPIAVAASGILIAVVKRKKTSAK
jgi:ABC-type uncharacterized transport system involved in gliding motility auxiliary subunit